MSVQLETSDGEIFTVPVEVAKMSVTIAHMLEDVDLISDDPDDAGSPIPLPNINSATLAKVLEYCRWHHANPNAAERGADGVLEWDRKFCEVERVILYHLILAAVHPPPQCTKINIFSAFHLTFNLPHVQNYLDIKPLLELACTLPVVPCLPFPHSANRSVRVQVERWGYR
jgi:hypothetical protein